MKRFDEFEVEEGDEADGEPCTACNLPLVPGDLVRETTDVGVGYEHATCTGEPT